MQPKYQVEIVLGAVAVLFYIIELEVAMDGKSKTGRQ